MHEGQECEVGPYDDVHPQQGERPFMELGCIDIPFIDGMEIIPALDEYGRVHSVSIVVANLCVEMTVFAAPRSPGLWQRSFNTLKEDAQERGYNAFSLTGRWGKELLIRPQSGSSDMPYRFVGIEGPRWLLRATYFGSGAENDNARQSLDAVVSHCVIHRGTEAKPPGEIVYLTLPEELREKVYRDHDAH